ncbi:MAG: PEP-CTERM sorting domain-containing protein [Betaproteobacteria bacterium]|nr:PEP-CTERM sorting domain-containing protein [Betaproteobacteria bacterium]
MSLFQRILVACAAFTGLASGAQAAPFNFLDDFSPQTGSWSVSNTSTGAAGILGQLDGGSATLSLSAPGAGNATLSFDLLGFGSVDAYNCCTDIFSLSVNGNALFRAAFSMGGGGTEQIDLNTAGATVTGTGTMSRHISMSILLQSGTNSLVFDYGQMQGLNDESWGLDNVSVSARDLVAPDNTVPEPSTIGLVGAAIVAFGMRARRTGAKR